MAAAVVPIREVRRRESLVAREAQSPLASSPHASPYYALHADAVAAWEADAIEPDVPSSRGSFYASVQSSTTSTDGESSPCSSRRRFRALRVSIRRHRRRRKSTFQYHVPVHLLARSSSGSARRRHSSALSHHLTAASPEDDATMLASFSSSTTGASLRGSLASNNSQSYRRSDVDGWRAWDGAAAAKHAVLESLSDADETPESSEPRSVEASASSTSASSSRRHRAWSKLKAHATRLPRLSRSSGGGSSRAAKAKGKLSAGLFSISFYPWKMEAHGYYSTPEAAVEWVPDTASARCQICVASFNLARRRHHCRLCGRLVCNECSLPRTFLPIAELAAPRRPSTAAPMANAHSLIKSGEPQRTCDSCAATLARMVAQQDHRVKQLCVDAAASSTSTSKPTAGRPSYARASDVAADRPPQLQLARPRGLSKSSLARHDELEQVLRARAKSRAARLSTLQHVISSRWLDQWLQFVQMDSGDAVQGQGHQRRSSQFGRPSMASSRGSMSSRRRSSRFAFGRRPGPIANYELLDFVNGKLVPRAGLRRSRGTDGPGDFHVISHDVWLVFRRLYGGGPCITIDDDVPSHTASTSHLMLHADADATPFDGDFGKPPPPPQWNITELDDADTTSDNAPSGSPFVAPNATTVAPTTELAKSAVFKERPARVQPQSDQRHLALRSTTACEFDSSKRASSRRPASATAIAMPPVIGPPPVLARSTSESRPPTADDPQGRRKSLTFIGYFKKWRQGDDTASRPSGASTTISQVDDDGVVLYDPARLANQYGAGESDDDDGSDDGGVDFSRSCGPEKQRETIAAVSAFASAAAEARRKSAMSLMRHSTALTTRTSSTRAASPPGVLTA